jgi:hypothetical protein
MPNLGMSGSRSIIDSKVDFWNNMFDKELLTYKDCLDAIFPCHLLETTNLNYASCHIFNHL